jgi:hypothetical protein
MSAKSDTRPIQILGMTIESNLEITLWMAALFFICGLLLAQEIHQAVLGHFFGPTRLRMNYWSIFPKVFEAIVAIYFFMFAFRIPKRSVKIASILMGTNFAVYALLSCFPISSTVGHIVAISGSVLRQIALVIYCMAIVQWLKSVIRRNPQPNFGGGT